MGGNERSDRFDGDDLRRLAAATEKCTCTVDVLDDAGHWLHVDNPAGLVAWMLSALAEVDVEVRP